MLSLSQEFAPSGSGTGIATSAAACEDHVMKLLPELIGVIAFIAVAIRVLTPLVTLSLSLRLAARMCLRRELCKNGIRRLVPEACVTEIAAAACGLQAPLAESLNWSPLLIKDRIASVMAHDARAIADWLHGASLAEVSEYLTVALRKHRVPFGLLAIAEQADCERTDSASGATG